MTWMLAAIVLAPLAEPKLEDFFPLKPGMKWTYQEQGTSAIYVDEVKPAVDVDGKPAFPIVTRHHEQVVETRYFRIAGDTAWLVANNDPLKPIPAPHPVLKLGAPKAVWTYAGSTMMGSEWTDLNFKAQSVVKGKRNLFGQDRDTLELTMDAEVDQGGGIKQRIHQVTLYAAGLGWFEMRHKVSVGSKSSEYTTRLLRFEAIAN